MLRARAKMRPQAGHPPSTERPGVYAEAENPEEVGRLERVPKTPASVQDDAPPLAQEQIIAQQLLQPPRQADIAGNEPVAAEVETPSPLVRPVVSVQCVCSAQSA